MSWRDYRLIAFDTETTGLDPFGGDRIIEFAGVELELSAEGAVARTIPHRFLFNPGIPIPRKVTELTGLRDEDVVDAPPFQVQAQQIWELLHGSIIIAHNLAFDQNFISVELQQAGLYWPQPTAEIDTLGLSILSYPQHRNAHKLETLCQRLGVSLDQAHRATDDAEACGRCFVQMTLQFDAPPELGGLLEWAEAVGVPPEHPYFSQRERLYFAQGPHEGELVEHNPMHLQWMIMARERQDQRWGYRFPESVRTWALRFLRARSSGRHRQDPKRFSPQDWTLDSGALPLVEQS